MKTAKAIELANLFGELAAAVGLLRDVDTVDSRNPTEETRLTKAAVNEHIVALKRKIAKLLASEHDETL